MDLSSETWFPPGTGMDVEGGALMVRMRRRRVIERFSEGYSAVRGRLRSSAKTHGVWDL